MKDQAPPGKAAAGRIACPTLAKKAVISVGQPILAAAAFPGGFSTQKETARIPSRDPGRDFI
jgi:hypothetical protein